MKYEMTNKIIYRLVKEHVEKRIPNTTVTYKKHKLYADYGTMEINNISTDLENKILEMRKLKVLDKAVTRLVRLKNMKFYR